MRRSSTTSPICTRAGAIRRSRAMCSSRKVLCVSARRSSRLARPRDARPPAIGRLSRAHEARGRDQRDGPSRRGARRELASAAATTARQRRFNRRCTSVNRRLRSLCLAPRALLCCRGQCPDRVDVKELEDRRLLLPLGLPSQSCACAVDRRSAGSRVFLLPINTLQRTLFAASGFWLACLCSSGLTATGDLACLS